MPVAAPTSSDDNRSAREMPYRVVAFGGSAGGINALIEILALLPASFQVPILVVQHLPRSGPTSLLPMILGRVTRLRVKWAENGERMLAGTVYIAPRDHHLTVRVNGLLELSSSPHVSFCRPAADPLFESIARVYGDGAIAVVLSGMLQDGADGVSVVRRYGGVTMAQSEATSSYFDMPRAAIDLGGSQITLSPAKIAEALCAMGT